MFLYHSISLLLAAGQVLVTSASKNPKRGLAFADNDSTGGADIKKANTSSSVVSWQYNWGTTAPDYMLKSGIPYVPMQWGTSGVETFASTVISQGAKTILCFNEPDLAGQSNLNATYAASLWKKYINPLSSIGVRLGAPAISSAPGGIPWLTAFLAACTGCTIDFLPLHWYGTGSQNFNNYIGQVHAQFPGKPLWITEFASTSMDTSEVHSFLLDTTSYMDSQSWVEAYAWFAYFRTQSGSAYNLLDANGGLNQLGTSYIISS